VGISANTASLLGGKVASSAGQALAGIPVRAHRTNSTITIVVYTNGKGEYSYPEWSEVSPGSYTVSVELADYEHVSKAGVTLTAGSPAQVDFTLKPRTPSVQDVTASDIVAALPGTDRQKALFIQCDNCHSLTHALSIPRDKSGWMEIITRMGSPRAIARTTPGSNRIFQKPNLEPAAEYLASIRGPGSSGVIPLKLRPRPTDEASTRIVVTEYDIPRAGNRREIIVRGDRRAAWPHDILLEPNGPYAYYTDHFSHNLGRLDRRTGEVKEFPFTVRWGMGRDLNGAGILGRAVWRVLEPFYPAQAGRPVGGPHEIVWDVEGNIVFGMGNGTVRFNRKTEQFDAWNAGRQMFGIHGTGVWYLTQTLHKLDLKTGEITDYNTTPEDLRAYDAETDALGRTFFYSHDQGSIGMYDPRTDQFKTFPTPTPRSGPRRGEIDAKGRVWMSLYYAGGIAMLDPDKGEFKEYYLLPGHKPFGPPFMSPYTVSVDNKNQFVWATDFNSQRIYRMDMNTEQVTEYFMPLPYEIRDLTVDETASRPTVWIPVYRAPAKLVKVEMY
jgi:streptogramin lyase